MAKEEMVSGLGAALKAAYLEGESHRKKGTVRIFDAKVEWAEEGLENDYKI